MHRYAIQITVADERDGALSGSTLREACSWGKVSTENEQMVFGEATVHAAAAGGLRLPQEVSDRRKTTPTRPGRHWRSGDREIGGSVGQRT